MSSTIRGRLLPFGSIVTSIKIKILSPGRIDKSLKTTPDSPSTFILKGESSHLANLFGDINDAIIVIIAFNSFSSRPNCSK